jgi:hypothetical protein
VTRDTKDNEAHVQVALAGRHARTTVRIRAFVKHGFSMADLRIPDPGFAGPRARADSLGFGVASWPEFVHLAVGLSRAEIPSRLQGFRARHQDFHHVVNAYLVPSAQKPPQ